MHGTIGQAAKASVSSAPPVHALNEGAGLGSAPTTGRTPRTGDDPRTRQFVDG